jgi:hypothetical protein
MLLCALLASWGCNHHDIGQPCPSLLDGASPTQDTSDPTTASTQEVVAEDPAYYTCESLNCIATKVRSGYCTAECLDNAGCPDGFECRTVQNLGPFAGVTFCAWKACTARSDCGRASDFCCTQVAGTTSSQEFRQCAFSNHGKCP